VGWNEWIDTVEIEPSVYAGDFGRLGEQVETLLRAGARILHWDVGDGHFVPPITMGPIVLASISELVHSLDGVIDVHLMTEDPTKHFGAFRDAGADSVTFHYEAVDDVEAVVRSARDHALGVGLAVKPATDVSAPAAAAIAGGLDLVLCMSVEPGYSGQEFIPGALERIRTLRALLPPNMHVQVDGGINRDNVRACSEAGASLFVAATAIFEHEDLARAYRHLVEALA
jgi:ribulose-phosphate 3-epimerase